MDYTHIVFSRNRLQPCVEPDVDVRGKLAPSEKKNETLERTNKELITEIEHLKKKISKMESEKGRDTADVSSSVPFR